MGRALYRASLARDLGVEVVAVNELGSLADHGRLARPRLRLRSAWAGRCRPAQDEMIVDGRPVAYSERERARPPCPGGEFFDVAGAVDEATGRFRTRASQPPPICGAGRLPGGGLGPLPGRRRHHRPRGQPRPTSIRPLPSGGLPTRPCTTNCLAPMIKVLDDSFGVEQGFITTVHA